MKFYHTNKKNGDKLNLKVYEKYIIYSPKKKPLPDIIDYLESRYLSIEDMLNYTQFIPYKHNTGINDTYKRYDYNNEECSPNTIVRHRGQWFISKNKIPENSNDNLKPYMKSKYWKCLDRSTYGNCILTDFNNVITSDFGYTYEDIHQMLVNNDWMYYINNNDYIRIAIDGYALTMRFNIDTYYDYSINNPFTNNIDSLANNIPHHIDMISDEVIPEHLCGTIKSTCINLDNTSNLMLFATNRYTKNFIVSCSSDESPDGQNVFYDKSLELFGFYSNKLNPELLQYLKPKFAQAYNRKIDKVKGIVVPYSQTVSINGNIQTVNMGVFWQPREAEIYGYAIYSNRPIDAGTCIHYPSFKNKSMISRRVAQHIDIPAHDLGTYSTYSVADNNTKCILIGKQGMPYLSTGDIERGHLICFRFM